MDESVIPGLKAALLPILKSASAGLTEYELMRALRDAGVAGFSMPALRGDALALFQTHFILFHSLYLLRDELAGGDGERLEISPLRVVLHPPSALQQTMPAEPDALREYYLDLGNLHGTSRHDVTAMLGKYFERMARQDDRDEALRVLGLEQGASDAEVKRRYRELAMQHHPDRGGDTATLQAINAAVEILLGGWRP